MKNRELFNLAQSINWVYCEIRHNRHVYPVIRDEKQLESLPNNSKIYLRKADEYEISTRYNISNLRVNYL